MSRTKQPATRAEKLARRDKTALPFGDTSRSIKAMRNCLYLMNKGLIAPFNPSVREATAISNDNIRKAAQAKSRRETYYAFATAHRQNVNRRFFS